MKLGEQHKANLRLCDGETAKIVVCSCGWMSTRYSSGQKYGLANQWANDQRLEFVQHLLEETEVVTFIAKLEPKMEQLAREIADEFCGGSETVYEAILAKII